MSDDCLAFQALVLSRGLNCRAPLIQFLYSVGCAVLKMRLSILSIPRSVPGNFGAQFRTECRGHHIRQLVNEVIIT